MLNGCIHLLPEIELLGKPGIKPSEIKTVQDVLNSATKTNHTQAVNEIAIDLKQHQSLKTPDAIIAATAIVGNLPLLTADKGFTKIKRLDIVLIDV